MSEITTSVCSVTIEVLSFDSIKILESGSTTYVSVIPSHGLQVGDFYANITTEYQPPYQYLPSSVIPERRKLISVSVDAFQIDAAYQLFLQEPGDIVALYKFEDKSQYLLDGSFSAILTAQQESDNITFTFTNEFANLVNVFFSDGRNSFSIPTNYEWNWTTKTWVSKTGYNYVRYQTNAEKVADNYVFGGNIVIGATTSSGAATATKYNISGDSWSNLTSATDARYNAFSAQINDIIYWYGGLGPSGGVIEKYDPGSDTWTALTSQGTQYHSGQGSNVGKVLFCNYMATGTNSFETTDILYSPDQDIWANYPVDNSAPSRMLARSGFSIDGFRSQILGGTTNGTSSAVVLYNTSANITCKTYSEKTQIPVASMESMSSKADNFAIYGGGLNSASSGIATAYYYSDVRDSWTAIDNLPTTQSQGMGV